MHIFIKSLHVQYISDLLPLGWDWDQGVGVGRRDFGNGGMQESNFSLTQRDNT